MKKIPVPKKIVPRATEEGPGKNLNPMSAASKVPSASAAAAKPTPPAQKQKDQTRKAASAAVPAAAPSSKSAVTIRKSKSTLPRSLAKDLRRHLDSGASSTRRALHKRINVGKDSEKGAAGKGCRLRIGSGYKALMYLALIVGLTGAVAAWLYFNKFGPMAARAGGSVRFRTALNLTREARGAKLNKTIRDSDPDLYLDHQGNIHRLSELQDGGGGGNAAVGGEFPSGAKGGNGMATWEEEDDDDDYYYFQEEEEEEDEKVVERGVGGGGFIGPRLPHHGLKFGRGRQGFPKFFLQKRKKNQRVFSLAFRYFPFRLPPRPLPARPPPEPRPEPRVRPRERQQQQQRGGRHLRHPARPRPRQAALLPQPQPPAPAPDQDLYRRGQGGGG